MPRIDRISAAVFDTHVWLWAAAGDSRAAALSEYAGRVVLSAISIWEVAMLESKGRVNLRPNPEEWMRRHTGLPVEIEALTPEIALESCRLEGFHGDPADRLVVATALVLALPLISSDGRIQDWNRSRRRVNLIEI